MYNSVSKKDLFLLLNTKPGNNKYLIIKSPNIIHYYDLRCIAMISDTFKDMISEIDNEDIIINVEYDELNKHLYEILNDNIMDEEALQNNRILLYDLYNFFDKYQFKELIELIYTMFIQHINGECIYHLGSFNLCVITSYTSVHVYYLLIIENIINDLNRYKNKITLELYNKFLAVIKTYFIKLSSYDKLSIYKYTQKEEKTSFESNVLCVINNISINDLELIGILRIVKKKFQ